MTAMDLLVGCTLQVPGSKFSTPSPPQKVLGSLGTPSPSFAGSTAFATGAQMNEL